MLLLVWMAVLGLAVAEPLVYSTTNGVIAPPILSHTQAIFPSHPRILSDLGAIAPHSFHQVPTNQPVFQPTYQEYQPEQRAIQAVSGPYQALEPPYQPTPYSSTANQNDDENSEYEFWYQVRDDTAGQDFGHREQRRGNTVHGSYSVVLPDGRRQIVDYVADETGYHPSIRYEPVY